MNYRRLMKILYKIAKKPKDKILIGKMYRGPYWFWLLRCKLGLIKPAKIKGGRGVEYMHPDAPKMWLLDDKEDENE